MRKFNPKLKAALHHGADPEYAISMMNITKESFKELTGKDF